MRFALNSAVIASGGYGTYDFRGLSWDEARGWLNGGPVESRIGYAETADLIASQTGVRLPLSRKVSALAPGDEALVVRLRYRVPDPAWKGGPTGARFEDWEVALLLRQVELANHLDQATAGLLDAIEDLDALAASLERDHPMRLAVARVYLAGRRVARCGGSRPDLDERKRP